MTKTDKPYHQSVPYQQPVILPSILSADFYRLGQQVADVVEAGCEVIHVDVMDGHFVPNMTFGPLIVEALAQIPGIQFDVHLMVDNPDTVSALFNLDKVRSITIHPETSWHSHRSLQQIRQLGQEPGVVLNPGTPLQAIEWVLDEVDQVLLMSVNPGYGGQSFIDSTLRKMERLADMRAKRGLNFVINVDGGVNNKTIKRVVNAGADWLVAGSAVFGADVPVDSYHELMTLAAEARNA